MTAPTSIAVSVDREEYSRFESDRDTVTVTVKPEGTGLANEEVTVQLVKSRRNKDVAVVTQLIDLVDDSAVSVEFDLKELVDEDACPLVRRGAYLARAWSTTDDAVTADSEDFLVSLVTVHRIKDDYLHGADLKASEVLSVKNQPAAVSGVEVLGVSRGHPQGFFALSYAYNDGGASVIRTLSWACGPSVTLVSGTTKYLLRRGNTNDYIEVRVVEALLPTDQAAEELLVEKKDLDEGRIRGIIEQAISWVEDVELHVYLEPTQICTEIDPNQVDYELDSDIPKFLLSDFDKKVDALTYYRARPGHWISIQFPYFPLVRIDELFGKVSNVRILNVALEWVEICERNGFVELVPFNQEIAFNFIGLVWVESLRGPVPIPNFWNFTATVGFCKTPSILIELVAKKAATDILTIAGQAFRGGVSSQSVSRDGVSESVSYTASATYGIYSATIEDYNKWIKATLKKMRASFKGPTLTVL